MLSCLLDWAETGAWLSSLNKRLNSTAFWIPTCFFYILKQRLSIHTLKLVFTRESPQTTFLTLTYENCLCAMRISKKLPLGSGRISRARNPLSFSFDFMSWHIFKFAMPWKAISPYEKWVLTHTKNRKASSVADYLTRTPAKQNENVASHGFAHGTSSAGQDNCAVDRTYLV